MSEVLLERDGGIALITLNRPDRLNAFDSRQAQSLNRVLDEVAEDAGVGVVVLGGAGRAFSSGADLASGMADHASLAARLEEDFAPGLRRIMNMPKPVIAAVQGPCAGIGCAYVLAADLAVMADDAYMMLPFVDIGLVPDGGITWHLARQLGHKRAFEFVVTGEKMAASRCLEAGLVNRVVATSNVAQEARQWAAGLLQRPAVAVRASKLALDFARANDFASTFSKEATLQDECGRTEDFREGVQAFLEKRAPQFKGR